MGLLLRDSAHATALLPTFLRVYTYGEFVFIVREHVYVRVRYSESSERRREKR